MGGKPPYLYNGAHEMKEIKHFYYPLNTIVYALMTFSNALRLLMQHPGHMTSYITKGVEYGLTVILSGEDVGEENTEYVQVKVVPGGIFCPNFRV